MCFPHCPVIPSRPRSSPCRDRGAGSCGLPHQPVFCLLGGRAGSRKGKFPAQLRDLCRQESRAHQRAQLGAGWKSIQTPGLLLCKQQGARHQAQAEVTARASVCPGSRDSPENSAEGLAGIEIHWQLCTGKPESPGTGVQNPQLSAQGTALGCWSWHRFPAPFPAAVGTIPEAAALTWKMVWEQRSWRWPWCDAVPSFYCPWPTCPGAALVMWAGGERAGAGSAAGHSSRTPWG